MSKSEHKQFWIYRNLFSGSIHFSTIPVKDSNEYEFFNHVVEYLALEQKEKEIFNLTQKLADSVDKQRVVAIEKDKEIAELKFENNKLRTAHAFISNIDKKNIGTIILENGELKVKIKSLFSVIEHGDDSHRAWLKNAIEQHFAKCNYKELELESDLEKERAKVSRLVSKIKVIADDMCKATGMENFVGQLDQALKEVESE